MDILIHKSIIKKLKVVSNFNNFFNLPNRNIADIIVDAISHADRYGNFKYMKKFNYNNANSEVVKILTDSFSYHSIKSFFNTLDILILNKKQFQGVSLNDICEDIVNFSLNLYISNLEKQCIQRVYNIKNMEFIIRVFLDVDDFYMKKTQFGNNAFIIKCPECKQDKFFIVAEKGIVGCMDKDCIYHHSKWEERKNIEGTYIYSNDIITAIVKHTNLNMFIVIHKIFMMLMVYKMDIDNNTYINRINRIRKEIVS